MPDEPQSTEGSLGLGLDAAAEAELISTIGIMFAMNIMTEKREEDKEMFPDEGIA